jgi:serine phosphatase RsbU (regulator of sigma subunit)
LRVSDDVIGLLALYPARGRDLTENESTLLVSLAAQLAVAVQNAQLHERATNLGTELESALTAERQSTRQLRALYEVSREFAQSLSLEMTLDVLARSVVELLGVDAAVIRMPDERGDVLEPRALHVADVRLADAVRAMLARPEPIGTAAMRLLFRSGEPLLLDAEQAAAHGGVLELLVPFLEKGSTAAVLPISTPAEVLASLTLLSLDPDRPITDDTITIALGIAAQAALAIDNARLYQQQKDFSDTMQRSLLPRARPAVPGLEIGDVYESSARVDVGGDVYDFMELDDGRLAVVLGDVTGHGIDAAADMAMAKFTFRALAREHPAPGDFLAHANDVVAGEIALGKFITMAYVAVDPSRDEVVCAGAGHPSPRFVAADGTVTELPVGGLALGIVPQQTYDEVREPFAPGSLVCLYTDGVVEARQGRELFGFDRLDETLARGRQLPAQELAYAVLAACREWAGGELTDDVAIVVIKRTS